VANVLERLQQSPIHVTPPLAAPAFSILIVEIQMTQPTSDCLRSFGHQDFDEQRFTSDFGTKCPIRDCVAKLVDVPSGKRSFLVCVTHGIQLRPSKTFVYWNGSGRSGEARLRNFVIQTALAKELALDSVAKAESHRLGYEMSEDALTWNVFVGLAEAGGLRSITHFLTGMDPGQEPELYLWGTRIDVHGSERGHFQSLYEVRDQLEKGIRKFLTEPDIMLVVPGRVVILVEAKFRSGNTLAHDGKTGVEEKPQDRLGLIRRYLIPAGQATREAVRADEMGSRLHSQLFRNLIFASEMSKGHDWRVVNLVSETQWRSRAESSRASFKDPSADIHRFLNTPHRHRFTFRTWEQLYGALTAPAPELNGLRTYMQTKSAHFRPAFALPSGAPDPGVAS